MKLLHILFLSLFITTILGQTKRKTENIGEGHRKRQRRVDHQNEDMSRGTVSKAILKFCGPKKIF